MEVNNVGGRVEAGDPHDAISDTMYGRLMSDWVHSINSQVKTYLDKQVIDYTKKIWSFEKN